MGNDRWENIKAPVFDGLSAFYTIIRNYFLTGVLLLIPVAVTLFIMFQLFLFADGILGDAVSHYTGYRIPGIGLVSTALICILAGMFAQNVIGKRILQWVDISLASLPVVRSLYVGIKQVSDVLFQKHQGEFKRVVMVEYPKEHSWTFGFVTGDFTVPLTSDAFKGYQMVTVYVPTTPNPTSGFLLVIEKSRIVDTSLDIEEAMKIVISGGLVQPGRVSNPPPQQLEEDFTIPH